MIDELNVAALIIHRGDRPRFLNNLMRMLAAQTFSKFKIFEVNYPSKSKHIDIVERYTFGVNLIRSQKEKFDCIVFFEVDDFYHPKFLDWFLRKWILNNKPKLFGTTNEFYYNLKSKQYFEMQHHISGVAACMIISPDLDVSGCHPLDPYFDKFLFHKHPLDKKLIVNSENYFIGIKHGVGLCGGEFHDNFNKVRPKRVFDDKNFAWLKNNMDKESFEFYSTYFACAQNLSPNH